ncbi:hypothetical protein [Halanaerobium salsuginis]|jgi:mRNA-degrading endonuclease RelE of RelBE toxin-antitoxin system|uniref:Uncharacterized protein n=1 Tax=Halanaerobium salsuginis TaxID=29563 RepID=A0A1I4EWW3_9FIRM|nr:hypothetical protein [Halanaerobium salsuginis]SFL09026.1 hypothetical protein SAMN02983006_00144 [Halanaerobium salsuginis]
MFKNSGYILILNLILLSLILLFIPILVQIERINFKITNNRQFCSQNKIAALSGIEYQLYLLKDKQTLSKRKLILNDKLTIDIEGGEKNDYYLLESAAGKIGNGYRVIAQIDKENLEVITKTIIRR